MKMQESQEIKGYFSRLNRDTERCYSVAEKARKKGLDPENKVDIPLARNMAERVEGLISAVAPQLIGSGVTERIQELEKEHGALAWEVALKIAEEVAKERFCRFRDRREAMEVGIRTGFAYHTVGIVAAPLEGFIELVIKRRRDGREYFAAKFAGPIRGAGGTASSVCLVIVDYVRKRMGYSEYDPDDDEVNRFVTELYDYHDRVTNLQYRPSEEEIRHLVRSIPVEVDGDPTEIFEVSNYKDLSRMETNRIRSGVCLVLSMVALKAPKLWKRMSKWEDKYDIDWSFLREFLDIQKKAKSKGETKEESGISANHTFISDLVAGRPVLTHPMHHGGFRLRYGRSRISGFSAASIHPGTMRLLNNYIATGTQLKVERPGKAAAITPCDSIMGPIIKLADGSVVKISKEKEVRDYPDPVEILYLGDIMFNYGDFSENGHVLVPVGYCEEIWAHDLQKAAVKLFGSIDHEKLAELTGLGSQEVMAIIKDPIVNIPSPEKSILISQKLDIPLHPEYTYFWNAISSEDLLKMLAYLKKMDMKSEEGILKKVILPVAEEKRLLELIGLPHLCVNNEFVIIERRYALGLLAALSLDKNTPEEVMSKVDVKRPIMEVIGNLAQIKIRDRSGTFVGARMGRPEKAKMRKLTGSPHVLFPVGNEGGRLRSFQAALEAGKIRGQFPIFFCKRCDVETIYPVCEKCRSKTLKRYHSDKRGVVEEGSEDTVSYREKDIDIKRIFECSLKHLGLKIYPDLIKGVRGTSNKDHTPENLAKGILRAKHEIYVNKDGTTRYDMSELPITHFKPKEIGTSVELLRKMGYTHDVYGRDLSEDTQVVELRPQDLILPASENNLDESADAVLLRVAKFVDEMLTGMYGQKPFYEVSRRQDLVGHLVIGLAPHTSAGIVGRIIGFSATAGFFAHPMFHAAMRRDCDGDEACVMLLMDGLLNFSRQFLPDKRGAKTMDSPLVLTSKLVPAEVDDMAHGLDVVWEYPLELYEAAERFDYPWDVKVEQLKDRLGTEKQYERMGYTHKVSDINIGVRCSAYKTLPSMEEKLLGQMELAERIRAVDVSDVARLVIEKHFLKDTRGNLRKFSMQQFRCVGCNAKFRRPPLIGKCTSCGGKIIFTISEGSVVKYLEPSISLAEKYELPPYLRQSLDLLKRRVEDVFGRDKEKQLGLGSWFS